MAEPVLRSGLRKRFGGLRVTDDVTLDVMPGELHAMIGPNGAGKTTLINQISGTAGAGCRAHPVRRRGRDARCRCTRARARGLARCFQITSVLPGFSALENVALAVQARAARASASSARGRRRSR